MNRYRSLDPDRSARKVPGLYVVLSLFFTLFILLLIHSSGFAGDTSGDEEISERMDRKQVTFYHTYGYLEDDRWVIPMRIYVSEQRRMTERIVSRIMHSLRDPTREEIAIFRSRIRDLVADSESRENVTFRFDGDPENKDYRLLDQNGNVVRTSLNGFKEGYIELSKSKAEELLTRQDSEDGWLSMRATSRNHVGSGRIQLIKPAGLSVISDIDDTIKITEIPAGKTVVIRNTFFKEFKAAPQMAEMYSEWEDATYHYVSGAPWQLYRSLSRFLFSDEAGFPEGTFHMKTVAKNLFSVTTWRGLSDFVTDENVTYNQKVRQISTIFQDFPNREFILVGDSGEKDPEVYRMILERFPDQVNKIIIRDVINDRENNPERLEGMEIISAPTIQRRNS